MMNTDTVDMRFSRNRSGWDFVRMSRVDGNILRTTLHIDTYYKFQSHGDVAVWTPNGWTVMSFHPGEELHRDYEFPSIHIKMSDEDITEMFEFAANILESPAITILSYNKESN